MTLLADPFEEGTTGVNIVAGNSLVDSVIAGTSLTFDNNKSAHGNLSCKCVTTANTSCVLWSTSMGSPSEVWFRGYFHLNNATPAATIWPLSGLVAGTVAARIGITTGLKVVTQESTTTTQTTSAASVNANAWFRLEAQVVFSASVGSIQVKLFNTMDSATPTETNTSGSALNTLGSADHYRFGLGASCTFTLWQDDIALSNVAYIGSANAISDTEVMRFPGAAVDGGPAPGNTPTIGVDDAVGFP